VSTASRRALNARVGSLPATVIAANVLARSALRRASVSSRGIDPAPRPSLQLHSLFAAASPLCAARRQCTCAATGLERMLSALDRGPPEQGSQLLCTFRVPPRSPADVPSCGFQLAVRKLTGARRRHPQQLPHGRRQTLRCARALSEVQLLQVLRCSVGSALRCGLRGGAGRLTKQQHPAAACVSIGLVTAAQPTLTRWWLVTESMAVRLTARAPAMQRPREPAARRGARPGRRGWTTRRSSAPASPAARWPPCRRRCPPGRPPAPPAPRPPRPSDASMTSSASAKHMRRQNINLSEQCGCLVHRCIGVDKC